MPLLRDAGSSFFFDWLAHDTLDEYCKILPNKDGKHVLVVGNFGAALLDMTIE